MKNKDRKANRNRHDLALERKSAKENRLAVMVDTLKELGKSKREILLALVRSGAKIRAARRIYRNAA